MVLAGSIQGDDSSPMPSKTAVPNDRRQSILTREKSSPWDDEYGCFVYKIINVCKIRDFPSVGEEHRTSNNNGSFKVGDLVSVDLVRPSSHKDSSNGPFLRLSDHSGWLFEKKQGDVMMKRMSVEVGFWTFYTDNYPAGIGMRRHPIDSAKNFVEPRVEFLPMEKIFCDRKVTSGSGMSFYRVQGTNGWVFDKRGEKTTMLLPENKVKIGLFVYKVVAPAPIAIRNDTDVGEKSKTPMIVNYGDLLALDAVRESPFSDGNGPFLRLNSGSGWLFEYKNYDPMMEEVPVTFGSWRFQVVSPDGIALRYHPVDNAMHKIPEKVLGQNEEVACDRMVTSPSGVHFYKVQDSIGWVFDKRDGQDMMRQLSSEGEELSQRPWTPDLVRGVALAIGGLREISFSEPSRLISFQNQDEAKLNVYYTTRNVGTVIDHPRLGKAQLFRRNCTDTELAEILKNPSLHTDKGYIARAAQPDDQKTNETEFEIIDGEVELRKCLVECEEKMKKLEDEKLNLWIYIEMHSKKRAAAAKAKDSLRKTQMKAIEDAKRRVEAKRQLEARTCSKCSRVFDNTHAMALHYRATHTISCETCGKAFESRVTFSQHQKDTGHY